MVPKIGGYSGWGYPNYYCNAASSPALCDSNSQNTQPEPGTCMAPSGSASEVAQRSKQWERQAPYGSGGQATTKQPPSIGSRPRLASPVACSKAPHVPYTASHNWQESALCAFCNRKCSRMSVSVLVRCSSPFRPSPSNRITFTGCLKHGASTHRTVHCMCTMGLRASLNAQLYLTSARA
jgi:hypothetical protein